MVDGTETEYLMAKERAVMMLGLGAECRLPSNRQIKDCIEDITKAQLGEDETKRRVRQMRQIAAEIMACITDADPFLIGSTLTGQIRESSDIDIHAYSDESSSLVQQLAFCGYEEIEEEHIENRKGTFIHLRWQEDIYPVEITVYPWSWRHIVPISSVTGKPMKRADLKVLNGLIKESRSPQADAN
jgi:hypothetical protein